MNPILALKNHVRSDARHKAADPTNVADHAQYLRERELKGKKGPVYVKSGLFGKYLSSKAPLWNKQNSLDAYGCLLTATVAKHLDGPNTTTKVGTAAVALHNFKNVPQPLTADEAAERTKTLERLVIDLACAKAQTHNSPAHGAQPPAKPKQPAVALAPAKTVQRPQLAPKGLRQTQEMQLRKLGQVLRHPESQAALAHMGEGIRSDAEVLKLVARFHNDVDGLVANLPQEAGISPVENLRRFIAESSLPGHVSETFGNALIHRYFDMVDSTATAPESAPATADELIAQALPEAPTVQQLDQFQLDLRQGKVLRPAYPAVDDLVAQLNRTSGTTADRRLDQNAASDLLGFILDGKKETHVNVFGEVGRQLNVFGDRTFDTPVEAAHFLFTETNFLESLNADDSERFKAVYLQLVGEAAKLKAVEAEIQDAEQRGVA